MLRRRYQLMAVVDAVLWLIVLPLATFARFDFDWSRVDAQGFVTAVGIAIVVHLLAGFATGIYLGRRKLASFEEVAWVAATAMFPVVALFGLLWLASGDNPVPRSAILASGAYQVVGALAFRYLVRVVAETRRRTTQPRSERVIVFGAGEAGEEVVRALREDASSDLLPVAFLDDDPAKARLRLLGLRIQGDRSSISEAAAKHQAGIMLIAMPSAPHDTVLALADLAQHAGLAVRVLPSVDKFLTAPVTVKDIRELTLADFLSREEVRLDLDEVAGYLSDKTVLVTGAGGSIGAQLCETIRPFAPKRVVMLDHAENSLHALQMRLEGRALLSDPDLVLADVRDAAAMRAVMQIHRPDVIFHAAAHKHVTFLERHPDEAVKTNVLGTLNVLAAAWDVGVERFVNISTDKAAEPVSVLGVTKRLAERLTAHYGQLGGGVFMSVRFGNVLGSDGSVIPTFREQLAAGEPLTVTHPEVTRYFMTIPEAVRLVVEAGAVGTGGDVLVLEMGEPVKILELAYRVAAEVSPGVRPEVVFTGLRQGEKLHETLFSRHDENLDRPHELLWRFAVPPLDPGFLDSLTATDGSADLTPRLQALVGAGLADRPDS